jgi:hypothetical protein
MIEVFEHEGAVLAMVIRASYAKPDFGIEFFTPAEYSQQVAFMNRPAGHVIPPHVHRPVAREVQQTKEVLFVRSGRLRVDLFSDAREYVETTELTSGDVILLVSGGHGFTMLEQTEIIEVKQGPFTGDADKVVFTPAPHAVPTDYRE